MREKHLPELLLVSFLVATVFTPVRQRAATKQPANARQTSTLSPGFSGGLLIGIGSPYQGSAVSFARRSIEASDNGKAPAALRVGDGSAGPAAIPSLYSAPALFRLVGMPNPTQEPDSASLGTGPQFSAARDLPAVAIDRRTSIAVAPGPSRAAAGMRPARRVTYQPFVFENPIGLLAELERAEVPRAERASPKYTAVLPPARVAPIRAYSPLVALVVAHLSSGVPQIAEPARNGITQGAAPALAGARAARLAMALHQHAAATARKGTVAPRLAQELQARQSAELADLTKPVEVDWQASDTIQLAAGEVPPAPGARTTSESRPRRAVPIAVRPKSALESAPNRVAENTPPQALEAVRAAQVVAGASQGQQPRSLESTIFTTPSYQQAAPIYTGKLISLDLVNADIRTFFRLIHKISGLNIVVDSDVTGTVTLALDDVPWDQALDLVLKDNDLGKVFEGNVLRIAKVATLTDEAKSQADLQAAKVSSEPLVTIFRRLKYAHVCDQTSSSSGATSGSGGGGGGGGSTMGSCGGGGASGSSGGGGGVPGVATILKKFKQGTVLSDRGSIVEDPRDNAIIITDVPSQIPVIESVINKLDTKSKQVSIQVRVILASANFSRTLSSVLGNAARNRSGSTNGAFGTGQGIVATANTPSPLPPLAAVTQPASVGATGFGAFAITNAGARYAINAAISAAEEHDQARTISRPTIVTQDNVLGEVQQGVQIPIQTNINNTIAVQYVNATLMLSVTPQVTVDGKVFLNIYVNNASLGSISTFAGPSINTQQATTQVLVPDGGTVVFGGITVTTRGRSATYVPLLGSIPVVGNLFKSSNVNDQNQELLFFVTPQVIPG
ncbi:MAG: type IV pilus secretin PilQ [Terriglobia bacterium]